MAGTRNVKPPDEVGGAGGAPEAPASECLAPTADDFDAFWSPPRAQPGTCTPEQISAKYELCSGDSGEYDAEACRAFDLDSDNAACLGCLFTAYGDEPSGALVIFPGDRWIANVGGCIALLDGDTTDNGCGARTQLAHHCQYGACIEACSESAPAQDWDACEDAARVACDQYIEDAACTTLPRNARCRHTSFENYFLTIGDIFCGAGPDGTPAEGGTGTGGAAGAGGATDVVNGEGGTAGEF